MAAPARAIGPAGWLRVSIRIALMLGWLAVCVPLFYVWRLSGAANPWPRRFLAGLARIGGISLRTIGQRPGGGEFLLANHVSWIDIPAIAASTGAAFVAHDGLAVVPLIRWLCTMNRTVFVARHDRSSVHEQVEQVRAAVRGSGVLAIFPEATTSDGTGLLPFKSSLLSALNPLPPGVSVQPVLLDYGREAAEVAWVGEESGLDNFLRILARSRKVELAVHFLEPLQGEALASRKTMASAAQQAILTALEAKAG